jgi:hypothetical protein
MGELPKLLDWQRPVAIEVGAPDLPAAVILEKSAEILPVGQVSVAPLESLKAGQAQVVKVLDSPAKASDVSKTVFDGQAKAADVVVSPAEANQSQGNTVTLSKTLGPRRISKVRVGIGAGVAAVIAGIGIHSVFAHAGPSGLSWMAVVDHVGRWAYCAGNGLAFVFPIPQIYKVFREGRAADTPVVGALGGGASAFSVGFISAPLLGKFFWGLQNLCGGLLLMASVPIERFMARQNRRLSRPAAGACTAAVVISLFAASWVLYAGAAALLAPSLTAWFGLERISILPSVIQVITAITGLLIFSSDIKAVWNQKVPKGFTSLFSLLYAASAVFFFIWTSNQAIHAVGSAGLVQWIVYAGQSAVYVVVATMSYVFALRQEGKPGLLQRLKQLILWVFAPRA